MDVCKKRFINGCWLVICLDAYQLKGDYEGQLLCAISKDSNDNMFSIAFTVVEAKTRKSWQWFITILLGDLGGEAGELG